MSNILVYVEENLLFSPEQCWEKEEVDMFNRDNKKSSENVVNVPLVSPQSTLNASLFKPTPEHVLLDTQKSCVENATTPMRTSQNKTESNTFTFHSSNTNTNTNPFLEDDYAYRQIENNINPQKFIELWYENLQLQTHITDILRILLNKVVKDSANDGNSNLKDDRRILDLIKSILSFFNKQMPLPVDNLNANTVNMSEDNVPTTANAYCRRNATMNHDFLNTEYGMERSTFSAMNQQPLSTTSHNKSNDFNASVDRFIQNTSMQNAFRNTSIKSTPLMPKNNSIDKVEQYLGSQERIRKPNFPPGFERLHSTSNSDQQCYLTNNVNKDFVISTNNPLDNNITVKETNPFKLSLAGKLHIPDAQEENCLHSGNASTLHSNQEPIDYDLISFENNNSKIKYIKHGTSNDCNDNSVDRYQYALTDPVNNRSSVPRNLFLSSEMSLNYSSSVNDYDAVSKVIMNEQPLQHNIHENELKTDKHEPITTTGIYNVNASCIQSNDFVAPQEMFKCKPINDNFISTSNDDLTNCRSSIMLPTNSLESLSLTNTNVDEGYLSRPPTSHTTYTSSPIIQLTNEALSSQKVMANNRGSINLKSACNDMWNNPFPNTVQLKDADKVPSVFNSNAEQITYDRNRQQNHLRNCIMENTLHTHLKIDNLGMSDTQETDLKSALGNARIPQYLSPNYKVLFQIVELPMHTVHVFHYQKEGWVLADEFVKTFTQYKAALSMISLLHMFNIHIQFEEIDRDKISVEVVKCNGILPKATQDIMNGTGILHLMQLKSALEVLHKLEIISDKDIRDLFVHENYVCGSTVHKIWLIFKTYAQLKYHIECEQ